MDLQEKRLYLFGHSLLDQYLVHVDDLHAVVFPVHIYYQSVRSLEQIYLPTVFLGYCDGFNKEFGSSWSWKSTRTYDLACTMYKARYSRLLASCWLANNQNMLTFTYTQNWLESDTLSTLDELLQLGGLSDWTREWGPRLMQLPKNTLPTSNTIGTSPVLSEFKILYESIYSNAAVCVVIGGIGWEHGCELCEKYLYAVYSGCIPVVYGYRIYDRLKALGFDTFDDIIDTSSQYDPNPITAIWNLFERNRQFFYKARILHQTPEIQKRLRKNLQLIQNLESVYRSALVNLNSMSSQQLYHDYQKVVHRHLNCEDLLNSFMIT